MASFNKFNCFVLDVASALHDMKTGTSHVYRIYLTNTAPVATTPSTTRRPISRRRTATRLVE